MTACDVSERTEIEALAIQLGWAIRQDGDRTVCGFDGQRLTVWWVGGVATRAIITNPARQETARRESYGWQTQPVGSWVRMMLHAIVSARPAPVDVEAGLRDVLDLVAGFRPIAETLRPVLERREAGQ